MAFTFIKTGADSALLAQKAAVEAELRKSEQGKLFRFWLKEKEEGRITFVDGDLNEEGVLCPPRFYEHSLPVEGNWTNYVCPEKTMPDTHDKCPICEGGEYRASLVALFTIIDHRQILSKDKTKTYKDTKRLLVAKPQTYEILSRAAVKRGGLTGCTFDAARIGDKSASVGSQFDFVEKHDLKELQKLYMVERVDPTTNLKIKTSNFTPADYEKEIVYRNGDQLREILKGVKGVSGGSAAMVGSTDYSKQL